MTQDYSRSKGTVELRHISLGFTSSLAHCPHPRSTEMETGLRSHVDLFVGLML